MPAYSFAKLQMVSSTAAVTIATIGPLAEVFDQLGALLFIFGVLGGITGHLSLKLPLASIWRPALLGGVLGFCMGVIAPPIIKGMLGVDLIVNDGSSRGMAGIAYVIGVIHERILAYLRGDVPDAE